MVTEGGVKIKSDGLGGGCICQGYNTNTIRVIDWNDLWSYIVHTSGVLVDGNRGISQCIENIDILYSVSGKSVQNHQVRSHEIISTTRTNTDRLKRGQRLKFKNLRRVGDRSQCLISRIVKSNSVRVKLDPLDRTNVLTVGLENSSRSIITDDCRDTRDHLVVCTLVKNIHTTDRSRCGDRSCLIFRNSILNIIQLNIWGLTNIVGECCVTYTSQCMNTIILGLLYSDRVVGVDISVNNNVVLDISNDIVVNRNKLIPQVCWNLVRDSQSDICININTSVTRTSDFKCRSSFCGVKYI